MSAGSCPLASEGAEVNIPHIIRHLMAQCFHRKIAYLVDGEALYFKPPACNKKYTRVSIPCGKCLACRVNNAAQWATRAMHESLYCDQGSFVTLTYNPEHCPKDYSLRKKDLQDFMKRLRITLQRRNLGHIRAFFACGEYGVRRGRPHYHILLLGWCPTDLVFFGRSYSGMPIYTSNFLESIWGKGFCPCGSVTSGSAAYVARYQKKGTVDNPGFRAQPFFLASRNIPLTNNKTGSLGAQWVIDNHQSLRLGYVSHPSDVNIKCRIPEYYFDLMSKWYPTEYEAIKKLRFDFAQEATSGFFVFDDKGKPNVLVDKYVDKSQICDYLGLDLDKDFPLSDLLSMLRDNIIKQDAAQAERLNRLKRNYE